jgi:hypothetical protein
LWRDFKLRRGIFTPEHLSRSRLQALVQSAGPLEARKAEEMEDRAHVNVRFSDQVEAEDEDEIREAKKVIQRRNAHDPAFGFAALHGSPRLIHVVLLLFSSILPLSSSPSRANLHQPRQQQNPWPNLPIHAQLARLTVSQE